MTHHPDHRRLTSLWRREVKSSLEGFHGSLIFPGQRAYEKARQVWNATVDYRPAVIARCGDRRDVVRAVTFAREQGLALAVRGGGHSVKGSCEGLVLDLSRLKGIQVDPACRRARIEPGVIWGELDRATQRFGLATTGAQEPTVGVAGMALGGGMGWLMRKHGLSCDNLLSAELVTAGGEVVTAGERDDPDLLWAVRGGGGNFGVATSLEFALHPVGPVVLAGFVVHPLHRGREFLRFYRDFVTSAPEELMVNVAFLTAPATSFVPADLRLRPVVMVSVCYAGDLAEGETVVVPLRRFGPPALDLIGPVPYVALQAMNGQEAAVRRCAHWRSGYLDDVTDEAIDTIVACTARITSPLSLFCLDLAGGAVARVGASETAFGPRDGAHVYGVFSAWEDAGESELHVEWADRFWEALEVFATGAVYVNYLGDEGQPGVRAAYGQANYSRLAALKGKYDPTNLFRSNQNILPAAQTVLR